MINLLLHIFFFLISLKIKIFFKQVRGVIRAEIIDVVGNIYTICRTIESTKANVTRFKTLDSALSRVNKDTKEVYFNKRIGNKYILVYNLYINFYIYNFIYIGHINN